MQQVHDLTNPDWISSAHAEDKGTGIIWLLGADNAYEQLFVPDITFAQLGIIVNAMAPMNSWSPDACRWVPATIQPAASLVQGECGGRCTSDLNCVNPACRCMSSRCRRK
jgi:hypothetical protein